MAVVDLQGSPAVFVHARIILHHFIGTGHGQPYTDMVRQFFGQFCQNAPGFFSLFVGEQSLGQVTRGFGIVPEGECFPETAYGVFDLSYFTGAYTVIFQYVEFPFAAFFGFFFRRFFPAAEQCF